MHRPISARFCYKGQLKGTARHHLKQLAGSEFADEDAIGGQKVVAG
jgi:hypothetical protein